MDRKEIVINDLVAASMEKENFSDFITRNAWEVVSYETAEVSGKGIVASPRTMPKPLTINPCLKGWYKIYVCMADLGGGSRISMKLSDDEFAKMMAPGKWYMNWATFEKVEEAYWKAADMTDQKLLIEKPELELSYTASLMWLRFVPMSDAEVEEYCTIENDAASKTVYAHMDGDFTLWDSIDITEPKELCTAIYHMKGSDVGIVAQESALDVDMSMKQWEKLDWNEYVNRAARGAEIFGKKRMEAGFKLAKNRDRNMREQIAYAHKYNMQFFTEHRMSMSRMAFPYYDALFENLFVKEHPEYFCKTRNGKTVQVLSYAYEEVQDYVIRNLKKVAECGVDGVTLIFTRGICVLFEQPVIDRFVKKYGDSVDFRRLPNSDPRVSEIKCDVMTDFMRKLRIGLDDVAKEKGRNRVKIYITAYYSAEESRMDGIDVERFAQEGLIDGFIQSNMTVYEEAEDVLDADGLIDLEKYTKKAENEYVVKRFFLNSKERTIQGLETYSRIAEKYGIKQYSEIQWEHTEIEPENYAEMAKSIYEKSKGGIALWDCYPGRVLHLSEWYCASRLGSMEHIEKVEKNIDNYRRIHKILSWNGSDISLYSPNWYG